MPWWFPLLRGSKWDVVVRAARRRLRGGRAVRPLARRAGARRRAIAPRPAAEELHPFGHHLQQRPLLAVLGGPLLELQAALDEQRRALFQVLPAGFGRLAPDLDADEGDLFLPFPAAGLVLAVGGQPQVGHRLS